MNKIIARSCRGFILTLLLLSSLISRPTIVRAEGSPEYSIIFNETGTHIKDGFLKVRLDYYPSPGTKAYDMARVYAPVIPPDATEKDLADPLYLDNLPHEYMINPVLSQFVTIEAGTTKLELTEYLESKINDDIIASIDDSVTRSNSLHLISPLMRDRSNLTKQSISDQLDPKSLIESVNNELKGLALSKQPGNILAVMPESINAGPGATNRTGIAANNSYIVKDNPSTGTGNYDTFEVWLSGSCTGGAQAGFSYVVSGNNLSTRDYEDIGAITSGSKQTFTGLNLEATIGDYLSLTLPDGTIEADTTGYLDYLYTATTTVMPFTNAAFYVSSGDTVSIYATGAESGPAVEPTVTSDNSSSVLDTTATLYGNITYTGGENPFLRGFYYGLANDNLSENITTSGNYTSGSFSGDLSGLDPGTIYYWQAIAQNTVGIGYGSIKQLETLPGDPSDLTISGITGDTISLIWNPGAGSELTIIKYMTDQYPDTYADGTTAYSGNGSSYDLADLPDGDYYFRGWSVSTDNNTVYSIGYTQTTGTVTTETPPPDDTDASETPWIYILCFLSIALLMINFFRFNILIVMAAVFVNIGITQQPGIPTWLYIAGILLAFAEASTGFVKLAFGRKNKRRYVG